MSTARFAVRIWNAAKTSWRSLPLRFVLGANWRVLREGGYGDGTLRLRGLLSDPGLSDIQGERQVEFYGRNPLPGGGLSSWVRLYRGLVKQPDENAGQPRITTVTLYGIYQQVSSYPIFQRYAFPGETDIAVAFSRIANRWIKPYLPGLTVRGDETGVTIEYLDAYRKTLSDAAQEMLSVAGGLVAIGGDVDENGNDRLFLRPFGNPASPSHVWPIPAPPQSFWKIGARERRVDYRSLANVLYLSGATPRHPNRAPRGAGMEYPTIATGDPGNEIGTAVLSGGASLKTSDDGEGPTDGGVSMIELDAVGETATWEENPPGTAIVVGDNYTAEVRARLESGGATGSIVTLRLIWLDVGNTPIGTNEREIEPDSVTFETYSVTASAPAGATGFRVEAEMTADGGDGIMVDTARFYNASQVYAEGMELVAFGSAVINAVNFAYEDDRFHGAYSLFFDVSASDTDGQDVVLRPSGDDAIPAQPRATDRLGLWVKNAPGETTYPKTKLQIFEYDGDNYIGDDTEIIPAGSYPDWTFLKCVAPLTASTTGLRFAIEIRGSGKGLIDAIYLRDDASEEEEYIEGVYEATLRADVLFGSGPVFDSITDYGERPALVDLDSINNKADADRYGEAALTTRALPLESPLIELIGRAVELWPGQYVRAVGKEAEIILPDALPIVEVEGKWNGVLSLTAFLDTERPNETRTARQIAKDAARRAGGASQVSYNGRVASSGSGGSVGSVPVVPVSGGGTGADNASDARTNLGLGSGLSVIVPLAKLTGGGANGSLTFTNGILTARVDPT